MLALEDRARRRRTAVGQLRISGAGSATAIETSRKLARLKDYNVRVWLRRRLPESGAAPRRRSRAAQERTAALETENKRLRRLLRLAIGKAHPVRAAADRPHRTVQR